MKKYLTITLLVINFVAVAQRDNSFETIIGREEHIETGKFSEINIIGKEEAGFFIYKKVNHNSFIVEYLNNKMDITKTTFQELKEDYELMFAEYLDNKLYLFCSKYDKDAETSKIYVQTINKFSLKQNNDYRLIAELKTGKPVAGKFLGNRRFKYILSKDSTKTCLVLQAKRKISPYLFVFDNKMEILWQKQIETQDVDIDNDFFITNNGNVDILINPERRPKEKIYYCLLRYSENGNSLKKIDLKLKNKHINSLKFTYNNKGNIICAGFYGSWSDIIGVCFFEINSKENFILKQQINEFSTSTLLMDFRRKRRNRYMRKNKKGYLKNYELDYLNIHKDNSISLTAEKRYTTESTDSDPMSNSKTTTTTYHNDKIIVIHISKNGNIRSEEVVNKIERSNTSYSHYYQAIINDNIFVVYEIRGDIKIDEFSKSGYEKSNYLTSNQVFVHLDAENCKQTSEKEIILWGKRRSMEQFIKLTHD